MPKQGKVPAYRALAEAYAKSAVFAQHPAGELWYRLQHLTGVDLTIPDHLQIWPRPRLSEVKAISYLILRDAGLRRLWAAHLSGMSSYERIEYQTTGSSIDFAESFKQAAGDPEAEKRWVERFEAFVAQEIERIYKPHVDRLITLQKNKVVRLLAGTFPPDEEEQHAEVKRQLRRLKRQKVLAEEDREVNDG